MMAEVVPERPHVAAIRAALLATEAALKAVPFPAGYEGERQEIRQARAALQGALRMAERS